jgi:hypothetical protein
MCFAMISGFKITMAVFFLLSAAFLEVDSQLCDDNPLANKGTKITSQASSSCLKGHTTGMLEIASCHDTSSHDIQLPFAFKFLHRTYNGSGSIFVSSNSYITFGGPSTTSSGLGPRNPSFPAVFIGARDNAMKLLLAGPDPLGWRVRYEGWASASAVAVHNCSLTLLPTIIWEVIFSFDGTLQICTGVTQNAGGISAVSDGASLSFVQKFRLSPASIYSVSTGLGQCLCDSNPQVKQGVKITSQTSGSCMKGRTPDMTDVRGCERAGSTSIQLPFPFKFLGRSYGGAADDVFVGDSSFVSFGGYDTTFYSSFVPNFSSLPALLIGARQNVLKSLSVGPDPLGWRVRYEGWSDHDVAFDPYPSMSLGQQIRPKPFTCTANANITWELLFTHEGTLQLCTGALMGNLDSIFDSIGINERICSDILCTNFFQNHSAVSAISDGASSSFVQKFDLAPSTLFTISTGVFQCPEACDDNPQANNGVNILFEESSSCLKERTSDMVDLGSCNATRSFDIRLPFPFYFRGQSFSGNDISVHSRSYITFPAFLITIGWRSNNALRSLSVGPDLLGWRVRYEGWSEFLSPFRTIECTRPADIIWEAIFMRNSSLQLCTSSVMKNLDPALNPKAVSGFWVDESFISTFSLAESRVYRISTDLRPCSLDLSLLSPIAFTNGSTLTAVFPHNLAPFRHDSISLTVTLQGAGFAVSFNQSVVVVVSPASVLAHGTASIANSDSATPLLLLSLRGVANCTLVSITVPSVATPLLPQSAVKDIRFAVLGPARDVIFSSSAGSLVAVLPRILIEEGQPVVSLTNNAMLSTTTVNITLTPNVMSIPAAYAPSGLVITLIGAGWSLSGAAQGQVISPQSISFATATITADVPSAPVLRVKFSGPFLLSQTSRLQVLVFNVTTVSVAQPAAAGIRSAIINSAGSVIASGTSGALDVVVASTMGSASPTVAVLPAVASSTSVRFHVALYPRPQHQQSVVLPASIIITLTGSGFECAINAAATFTSPFDGVSAASGVVSAGGSSIMTVSVTSGTFLSGYPILFQLGPCSTPGRVQPQSTTISAAMIDRNGRTVAASSSGKLSGIVADAVQPIMSLTDNVLRVAFTPRLPIPANSLFTISLTGIGLVFKGTAQLVFSLAPNAASGSAVVVTRTLESVLQVAFATAFSTGNPIEFSVSPVYSECSASVSNISAALLDKDGVMLSATMSSSFYATTTRLTATIRQLIASASNGVIDIPQGTYAGKCNCNNTIDASVPARSVGVAVQMKGAAGRTIIDCSGTGMRCLIVRMSSVFITNIIFKGGSSPTFVSSAMMSAVQDLFDAENPNFNRKRRATASVFSAADAASHIADFNKIMHRGSKAKTAKTGRKILFSAFSPRSKISSRQDSNPAPDNRQRHAGLRRLFPGAHRNQNRRLLQSAPAIAPAFPMFSVEEKGAGGCVLMLASSDSVSLSGVSFFNCSAVFGAAGFFNVSIFSASEGKAEGNIARQGGGLFVAASVRTDIESFEFADNVAVSSLISPRATNKFFSSLRMFASVPDAGAAAGAGAWIMRLTTLRNCTFLDNTALAAAAFLWSGTGMSGAHAVGSGIYVLQTSSNSVIANLRFSRCESMCAGQNCIAAGSLFLASAGFSTSMQGLQFVECQVAAVGVLFSTVHNEALGSCISVMDASAGLLKVENVESVNCSAKSSSRIMGGCMCMPQEVNNAQITQILVSNFSVVISSANAHAGTGFGGVLLFTSISNSAVSAITLHSLNCSIDNGNATLLHQFYAPGIFAYDVKNSSLSSIFATNVAYFGNNGRMNGGLLTIAMLDEVSVVQNISLYNSSFSVEGQRSYVGFSGFAVYFYRAEHYILRHLTLKNVNAQCVGPDCIAASACWFAYSSAIVKASPESYLVDGLVLQNVTSRCVGERCSGYALIHIRTEMVLYALKRITNNLSLSLSNVLVEDSSSSCKGIQCMTRGGVFTLSVTDGELHNIQVRNVTASAEGNASFAGGSFLFHTHNNAIKTLLVSNITCISTRVIASGPSSSAIGGAVAAIYGNLTFVDGHFFNSNSFCSGHECQSAGGVFSFLSSLGPSNKRADIPFSASVLRTTVTNSAVDCDGVNCTATGGAIFAGVAYRGTNEIITGLIPKPPIAPLGVECLPLNIRVENCTLLNNAIKSTSIGAKLSGAGVSILSASARLRNVSILRNSIFSSENMSFVGGGGIFVSGSNSTVFVTSSTLRHNSVGRFGSGGGIFVGGLSSFTGQDVLIEFSSARKGGGIIIVDGAALFLSRSSVHNNSAVDKGGGLFCVVLSTVKTLTSNLSFDNVTVLDNRLSSGIGAAVGASVYVFGDVRLAVRNGTRIEMNGNTMLTTTESIISTSRPSNIDNSTALSCKGGSVLSLAATRVEIDEVMYSSQSSEYEFTTQCGPACQYVPKVSVDESGGFLLSCVPCPRGTYSLSASANFSDTINSQCVACPFGAMCHGGNNISAAKNYWGWKVSEGLLARRFQLLPSGYACEKNCTSISPCGGNRDGVLCGACATNYSVAFFSTECVPSGQCSSWKWALLLFICILYQFCFSLWMFWSSEAETLRQISKQRTLAQQALKSVSLFDNLSSDDIDILVSKMELVHVPAQTFVITQGHLSSAFYFIKKGVLNVHILDDTGKEILGRRLVPPDVFGETSCINGTESGASIRSAVDCELWKLDRSCLDIVSDIDKLSYFQSKQLSDSDQPVNSNALNVADDGIVSDAFGVLMWFYQITGIMLSVTSPIGYLKGTAIVYSIVSFFSNSKPSSQAASDAATSGVSLSDEGDERSNTFQFCVDPSFTTSQLYVTSFMYYVCWALLMAIFARKRFWRFLRRVICTISLRLALLLDILSGYFERWYKDEGEASNSTFLQEYYASRQTVDVEIRGPVVLKWFIACFNAVAILMMQGTTCFLLNGYPDAAGSRRWIYDGRVVCFSNDGEFPGRWQVASAFGIAILFIAPAVLWRIMTNIQRMNKILRTPFQETFLEAYSGTHASNACHWKVVM